MSKIIQFPEAPKLQTFKVVYEINIDAETPQQAAIQAALIIKKQLSDKTCFPVIMEVSLVGSLGVKKQVEVSVEDILKREEAEN